MKESKHWYWWFSDPWNRGWTFSDRANNIGARKLTQAQPQEQTVVWVWKAKISNNYKPKIKWECQREEIRAGPWNRCEDEKRREKKCGIRIQREVFENVEAHCIDKDLKRKEQDCVGEDLQPVPIKKMFGG
jgi:hypothetical protein